MGSEMCIRDRYRRRLSASNGKIPFSALYKSATGVMTLEKYNELNKVREICSRIMNEVTHGELVSSTTNREITYHEEDLQDPILCPNIASGLKKYSYDTEIIGQRIFKFELITLN